MACGCITSPACPSGCASTSTRSRSTSSRAKQAFAPGTTNEPTGATGLEPATSAVTGQRSNQLSYAPCVGGLQVWQLRLQVACRNFWGAREFERPSTDFPEDEPNPAVGAL